MNHGISKQTLHRLPLYLNYCTSLPEDTPEYISSTAIAEALNLYPVQVRKDLASIGCCGRPKVGYVTKDLIEDIRQFLGYNDQNSAIIVGAGKLGKALLSYSGFDRYGLDILAAFDCNPAVVGTTEDEKQVLPVERMKTFCKRLNVRIGIITVPSSQAQNACDALVESGIRAIWNFAPVHLHVPENILVQNENMASSLAVLSNHLAEQMQKQ